MSNVLNTVYNNYLTTYTPKALTRYDAHKKSELRNVYNSIVKQNKDAPWYLPTTNKETQYYAVDLKENARELYNTIAGLGGLEQEGLLNKKTAYSSDENIATATFIGDKTPEGTSPEFTLEVKALATPQENTGAFLPDEKVTLPAGTYSFDVSINDMNYEFQFSIGEGETNKDVQSRLVRLIDNSNIGIKATLIEEDALSALQLTSEATGQPQEDSIIFYISDEHTSKASGTVNYFGLNSVTREPANAEFLLNGEERSTPYNRFTVGNLFDVSLTGISEEGESITLGLKADAESLADNVSRLLGGYNSFMQAASSYLESQSRSSNLVRELRGIASHYSESMESTGLTLTENGTLQINESLLKEAAEQSEDIADTFSYLKEFSDSLLKKSRQVSLNPMDYVNRTIVAYKKPGINYVSPYHTSAYSGMMFNSYC
ncbi:MAG: flagellar capping protein [Lachnospiraceae bacterium]|nr:flagellar capping protein [Lachnospiraceae bacterium]